MVSRSSNHRKTFPLRWHNGTATGFPELLEVPSRHTSARSRTYRLFSLYSAGASTPSEPRCRGHPSRIGLKSCRFIYPVETSLSRGHSTFRKAFDTRPSSWSTAAGDGRLLGIRTTEGCGPLHLQGRSRIHDAGTKLAVSHSHMKHIDLLISRGSAIIFRRSESVSSMGHVWPQ